MANYSRNNILCQAYIHADKNISHNDLIILQKELENFVTTRAKFFFYEDVETNVKIEKGSVITWATILGTFSALYYAIANYKNFKDGIIEIYNDVRRFSDAIVSESLFQSKTKHNNIIRIESRPGIIGNLKRLIEKIEFIHHKNGSINPDKITHSLEIIYEKTEELFDVIENPKDTKFIAENLLIEIEKLPEKPLSSSQETPSNLELIRFKSHRNKSNFSISAGRYFQAKKVRALTA